MSMDIGFASQAPSLPTAGAAQGGLGETFTPDLSTGTGTLTVPLETPNGPGDIGPKLALRYDSSAGNGPFGLGWSIPLPRILRSTMVGQPHYDERDTLVLEGSGPLVQGPGGTLVPQVETGEWRIETSGDGFLVTDRAGTRFALGTTPDSRIPGLAGGTWAWLLHSIEDNTGQQAHFTWRAADSQRYLDTVGYGAYVLQLTYEQRPDPLRWGRGGFLLRTDERCVAIELQLAGTGGGPIRTWSLGYTAGQPNGASLLSTVTLTGHAADGSSLATPPLTLGYTTPGAPTLHRIPCVDEGCAPPALTPDGRVDLVDWTGTGLADVISFDAAGGARVWPNAAGRWQRPTMVGDVPQLAGAGARAGLIDVNGDGLADIVRLDAPLAGYQPRTAAGFGEPVSWATAPAIPAGAPGSRLVDLDGDGLPDMLWSAGNSLLLASQVDGQGWQQIPQVVPATPGGPPTDLTDPRVHVADMTGDGSPDLVRVAGGGVSYWPYLGYGVFGDRVDMADPPALPFDTDPATVLLVDVDGDGCADVVQLTDGTLRWWPNRSGDGFQPPREIDHLPPGMARGMRVADLLGTGAPQLCWSALTPIGSGRWFTLDPCGGTRCGLLATVDNGVGRHTEISWTTTARQRAADADAGRPWPSRLPFALPVVASTTIGQAAGGAVAATSYQFHDGRYDGVLREFCGFGQVDTVDHGDASVADLVTTRWFHTGLSDDGSEPATLDDRQRQRAIRGRCYAENRGDGTVILTRTEQAWQVVDVTPGSTIAGRLTSTTRLVYEGAADPTSRIVTEQVAFDADGNVTRSVESSYLGAATQPTAVLTTTTSYATDPAGRYRQRICRIQQADSAGSVLADTTTAYDGLPVGQVGGAGLVTERLALALTDDMVSSVYGTQVPDLAGNGYLRVPGSTGWWVRLGTYQRTVDAAGVVHGSITGPLGGTNTITFDATGCYPVSATDAVGNTISCQFDPRSYQPVALVDPSGARSTAAFDALARLTAVVHPGDSDAAPTTSYRYDTTTTPVQVTVSRAGSPGGPPVTEREFLDGDSRLLQRRRTDATGEFTEVDNTYGARNLLVRVDLPSRPAGSGYAAPDGSFPHGEMHYDALGRVIRTVRPDGAAATTRYLPGVIEITDEAGHLTRRQLDPAGRVTAVDQVLSTGTATSSYTFDIKGNLTEHVDAVGSAVRFGYDLLGRTVRIDRPETTQIVVLDAAGNPVEVRAGSARVYRTFDRAGRLTAIRHDDPTSAPVTTLTYQDGGSTAPTGAGAHTAGGRLVRVDSGAPGMVVSTVLDYDERGRIASKTMTVPGQAPLALRLRYRSDDLLDQVAYPGGVTAGYGYDPAGRLITVTGVIDAVDYDLTGRRTRTAYANGTVETHDVDPLTGWNRTSTVTGPSGTLRSAGYGYDASGNLTGIVGQAGDPSWTYGYDEMSRLVSATGTDGTAGGSGYSYDYTYDAAGNITSASDVGSYRYGGTGTPAGCLASAGPDDFGYDDRGNVTSAPWGTNSFDAEGRLVRIDLTGGGSEQFGYSEGGRLVLRQTTDAHGAVSVLASPDVLLWIQDGTPILQFTDGDHVVAREQGGARTWLHADHLGSIVLVTDQAGAAVRRLVYGPYGQLLSGDGSAQPQGFATGEALVGPGLVLLGDRWYCPRIGRFLSADPVVGDAYDPLAWNGYAYCRCNPTSYFDPTGHSFWQVFGAVLATVAIIALVVVVSVITFGVASPGAVALGIGGLSVTWGAVFAATMVGVVAGGVIGGIAAARAGGDAGDIVLGVLVGAAVGGWAAFGAAFAGVAVAGGLGLSAGSIGAGAVAGGVSGAINGAAMGFASGFAGGKNNGFKDIMEKVLVGAIVGAAIGAALGALSGVTAPKGDPRDAVQKALTPQTPSGGTGPTALPPGTAPTAAPSSIGTVGGALEKVGTGLLGKVGGALFPYAAASVAGVTGSLLVQTIAVDLAAGPTTAFWDDIQRYLRTQNLGPFNFISGSF